MLGGVGDINKRALRREKDVPAPHVQDASLLSETGHFKSSYDRFVYILNREHSMLFGKGKLNGEDIPISLPADAVPSDKLSDWTLSC